MVCCASPRQVFNYIGSAHLMIDSAPCGVVVLRVETQSCFKCFLLCLRLFVSDRLIMNISLNLALINFFGRLKRFHSGLISTD